MAESKVVRGMCRLLVRHVECQQVGAPTSMTIRCVHFNGAPSGNLTYFAIRIMIH